MPSRRSVRERDFSDAVLNSLPGIFYMYDPVGKPVRWNRQVESDPGVHGASEISAMTAADFFVPADRRDVPETIAGIFATGTGQGEATLLTRDGREIPTYLTGVRATVGEQDYMVGVGIDISDRKQTEQALRDSEARFRAFFVHAAIGIALVNRDGEVQEANAAFEAMSGVRRAGAQAPIAMGPDPPRRRGGRPPAARRGLCRPTPALPGRNALSASIRAPDRHPPDRLAHPRAGSRTDLEHLDGRGHHRAHARRERVAGEREALPPAGRARRRCRVPARPAGGDRRCQPAGV